MVDDVPHPERPPLLSLKIDGPGIRPGYIELAQLKELLESVDQLVKRAANFDLRAARAPGAPAKESWGSSYSKKVLEECRFAVTIKAGSAVLELIQAGPVQAELTDDSLPKRAVARVLATVDELAHTPDKLPSSGDSSVVETLGKLLDQIDEPLTLRVSSAFFPQTAPVEVTPVVRQAVKALRREPLQAYQELAGYVHLIQDAPEMKFNLETVDGSKIKAEWDERHRETLVEAFRSRLLVSVKGIAHYFPNDQAPRRIVADTVTLGPSSSESLSPRDALKGLAGAWDIPKNVGTHEFVRRLRKKHWGKPPDS